jgi:serine/threonine-protein kinase
LPADQVVRLDAEWTTQTLLPFTDIDPQAVAVGADGSVYVSDVTNRAVSKWTPGTKNPVALPITGLLRPTSIAVDAAGNVYVSDFELNQVLKLPVM